LGQAEQGRKLADAARGRGEGVEDGEARGVGDSLEASGDGLGPRSGLLVTGPDTDPDYHEIGKVEVEARTEEQARDEVHRLSAFDVRSDPGQALSEDVTPRRYEYIQ
jgi:hypothetical protein